MTRFLLVGSLLALLLGTPSSSKSCGSGAGVRSVPEKLGGEPGERLIEWMKKKNVRYYLYRPPESPWRL